MRDVGHEVAAHGFKVREVRGVVRDHQFLEAAKRNNAYRERPLRLRGRGHLQRLAVLAAFQVGVERRIAHQVDEALAGVARRGNTEQALARDVRPLDLVLRGDDQHGVRRGGRGALEARQHFGEPVLAPLGVLRQRADAVEHLAPQAAGVRHVLALVHQPAVELHQIAQLGSDVQAETERGDQERIAGNLGQQQARERDADEYPDLAPEIPGHASVLGREPVAGAAHRLDETIVAARGECLAQAADVHVHGALLHVHIIAPDAVQDALARVHALRVGHEEVQQAEFHRSEFELYFAGLHAVRHRVERQAAHFDRFIRGLVARCGAAAP